MPQQGAGGDAHIAPQPDEPPQRVLLERLFLRLLHAAEGDRCASMRLIDRHTGANQLFGFELDVLPHLGIHLRLDVGAPKERSKESIEAAPRQHGNIRSRRGRATRHPRTDATVPVRRDTAPVRPP